MPFTVIHQFLGIPLALLGAVFLAFGTQLQSRGVKKLVANAGEGESRSKLNLSRLMRLLARPSWVFGTLLLGLAIVSQLASLYFAPLIVVQPLGAIAIAITAVLNARYLKVKLERRLKAAIGMCVGGVAVFVAMAAAFARDKEVTEGKLLIVLALVLLALIVFGGAVTLPKTQNSGFSIVGAGVLYGFVVTLAAAVINRLQHHNLSWLTLVAILALLAAAGLGAYLVQRAHLSGSPDLVVAGLTVIDPLVAISIGALVLNEVDSLPFYGLIVLVFAAIVAVYGVWRLSKYHSQADNSLTKPQV